MKTLLLSSCALVSFLALNGCAASAADPDGGIIEQDGAVQADSGPKKDGASTKDTGTQVCVTTCASDLDCQNSCPTVPQGENCCDTSTGICYAYSATTCPAPVADAGFD